jgi:hypothetical protein
MQNVHAIEMVMFKTNQQVSEQEAQEALLSINPIINTYPGFVSRVLSKNSDDFWLDIVYWKSMDEAKSAAQEITKDPEVVKAFSVIDGSTVQIFHFTPAQFFHAN